MQVAAKYELPERNRHDRTPDWRSPCRRTRRYDNVAPVNPGALASYLRRADPAFLAQNLRSLGPARHGEEEVSVTRQFRPHPGLPR